MKTKTILVMSIIFLLNIFCIASFAHPPKNIVAIYDKEKDQIEVEIEHNVTNPKIHYVKEVVVKSGDSGYFIEDFPRQSTQASEKFTVKLPKLKKGDKIEIIAKCSVYGKKTYEIIVD
jgi:hypothetical protein